MILRAKMEMCGEVERVLERWLKKKCKELERKIKFGHFDMH